MREREFEVGEGERGGKVAVEERKWKKGEGKSIGRGRATKEIGGNKRKEKGNCRRENQEERGEGG